MLYDLVADPSVSRDVIADHPREAERLRACLPLVPVAVDDDGMEADEVLLRALGYVD